MQKLRLILFCWLMLSAGWLQAQPKADSLAPAPADSTMFDPPVVRYPLLYARDAPEPERATTAFDTVALNKFKTDRDYQYDRESQVGLSLWERFLRWLAKFLPQPEVDEEDIGNKISIWTWLLRLVAALVLVFAVTKLLGIEIPFNLDFRGKKTITATALTEDIHTIDFPQMIAQAIASQDYRSAVRLYYLQALKQMTDRSLIDWRNWKTNDDYVHEIANPDLRFSFNQVTLVFDYTWYGEFAMDETSFVGAKAMFERFGQQVVQTNPPLKTA
jgi:Domain of unknown function (DUF4129)